MFNSFMSILGTPVATTPAANVTIATTRSHTSGRRHPSSNSTALELDGSAEGSHNISSPSVSPVKENRENAMSTSSFTSSSYSVGEENLSHELKHSIQKVNLDDPAFQSVALRYLLEKVRDHEGLLIDIAKENKGLKDEIGDLYKQNDALAAENANIEDVIASNKELQKLNEELKISNEEIKQELKILKDEFSSEKDVLRHAITRNADDMRTDIGNGLVCLSKLVGDIDYLDTGLKEIQLKSSHNQIQVESLKDSMLENHESLRHFQDEFVRLEKNINFTNQYGRRENLIIDGIPDHVPEDDLEDICLDIIHNIGFLPVGNYDVVGCHRLKKRARDSTTPIIIRFINRKVPEYCKRNKWRLKNLNFYDWNINFRDDLCEANEAILAKCEALKVQGHLKTVFTYNGFVKVARNKETPIKLSHMNDLSRMFPTLAF